MARRKKAEVVPVEEFEAARREEGAYEAPDPANLESNTLPAKDEVDISFAKAGKVSEERDRRALGYR